MIKTSIEKISYGIGYDIGHSDDQVQSDLLNGFSDALCNSIQGHDFNMQLCYIVDKLNPNAVKVIEVLKEFIKMKKDPK